MSRQKPSLTQPLRLMFEKLCLLAGAGRASSNLLVCHEKTRIALRNDFNICWRCSECSRELLKTVCNTPLTAETAELVLVRDMITIVLCSQWVTFGLRHPCMDFIGRPLNCTGQNAMFGVLLSGEHLACTVLFPILVFFSFFVFVDVPDIQKIDFNERHTRLCVSLQGQ